MKLPNGYGSVTKLKGRRRKPWAVRKTVHLKDGSVKSQYIGYYASKTEALAALASYNKHPYQGVTMDSLFDKWADEADVTESTLQTYRFAYQHIGVLGNRDMSRISFDSLQEVFDGLTTSTAKALKNTVSGIFTYAVRHEYIQPERLAVVKYIRIPDKKSREVPHTRFTKEEMESCTDPAVRVLLYTGMRISELLNMTPDCVHLDERYMEIRKAKTKAGVRKVPIAEKIVEDVKVLDTFGMDYYVFRRHHFHYDNHTVHDTRHTTISCLADLGVDERVIRAIVGHAGGLTETVYTHLDMQVLLDAVNRL